MEYPKVRERERESKEDNARYKYGKSGRDE